MGPSSSSYYCVLGVRHDASVAEIRSAYRKQAMKWHPDKCRWMVDEANRRFQQIQQAYQVLSDNRKRRLYDAGLYDPPEEEEEEEDDDDEVEGFSEFVGEMLNMMADVRREEKEYTIGELQQMLADMVHGFDSSSVHQPSRPTSTSTPWYHRPAGVDAASDSSVGSSRSSKRFRRSCDSHEEEATAPAFGRSSSARSYQRFGQFSSSCVS